MKRITVAVLTLMTILAGSVPALAATPPVAPCKCAAQADDWDFRAEASQLLGEIRTEATQLSKEAAVLETYPRGKLDWQSHANQLMVTKKHINEIGQRLERLQSIRHAAEPWHARAVESIVPVAANLATSTDAAIRHLNANRNWLFAPAYTGYLSGISERADQVKEYVSLHLDLADTRDRLEQLQDRAARIGS